MWIGDEYYGTIVQIGNQQILVLSAVTTTAALSLWVLRSRAEEWLRSLVLCGTFYFFLQMGAGELVLYLAASVASIAICQRLLRRADPRPFSPDRSETLLLVAAICLALFLAFREPGLHRATWFVVGASAGVGVAVMDVAARANRYWFLKLSLATAFALLFVSLATSFVVTTDPLGFYDALDTDSSPFQLRGFSIGLTGLSMLLFGIWRLLTRLAVSQVMVVGEQGYWRQLGTGYRRVLRLLLVWPSLIALSLFMFTPWFEVYCRMPSNPTSPPPVLASQTYRQLMHLAQRIKWPQEFTEAWSSISEENAADLVANNSEVLAELAPLLERPIVVPISYVRLSKMIHPSQFLALGRLATLIIAAYADGADKPDVDAQYNAIRQLLLLSKPLQQSPLLQQGILGRKFEEMAFYLAYISREQFTPQQYRELVNLLNESSNWCPSSKIVGDRFLEWQLVTRGWREAVSLATAPPFDSPTRMPRWRKSTRACEAR